MMLAQPVVASPSTLPPSTIAISSSGSGGGGAGGTSTEGASAFTMEDFKSNSPTALAAPSPSSSSLQAHSPTSPSKSGGGGGGRKSSAGGSRRRESQSAASPKNQTLHAQKDQPKVKLEGFDFMDHRPAANASFASAFPTSSSPGSNNNPAAATAAAAAALAAQQQADFVASVQQAAKALIAASQQPPGGSGSVSGPGSSRSKANAPTSAPTGGPSNSSSSRMGGFGLSSVAAALGNMRGPSSASGPSTNAATTPAQRSSLLVPDDGNGGGVFNLTYPDQSGSGHKQRRSSQPGPGGGGRPIMTSASATPGNANNRGTGGGGGASSSSIGSYNPNSLAMLDANELFGADAGPYVPVESSAGAGTGAGWSDVAILRLLESNGRHEQGPPAPLHAMPASAPAHQTSNNNNPFPGITPAQVAQIYQSLAGNPGATVAAAAAVAQSYQPSMAPTPQVMNRAYSQQFGGHPALQSGSPFSLSTQDSQSVFSSLFESVPGLGIHTGYDHAPDSLASQLAATDTSGLTSFFEHFLVDQGDDDVDLAGNGSSHGGPDFGTPATNFSVFSSSQPKDASDIVAPPPPAHATPSAPPGGRPAKLARAETISAIMTTKSSSSREHSRGRTSASRGRRMSSGVDEAAASAAMPPPAAPPRGGVGAHRNSSRSRTRQSAYARPPLDTKQHDSKSALHAAIDKVQAQAAAESTNPLSSRSSMSHATDSPGSSQSVHSAALSPVMGGESRAPKGSGSSRRHSMDENRPTIKADDSAMSTVDEVTIEEPDDGDGDEAEADDVLRPLNAEELALARKSRRRLSHNEVERKRRETINEKIQELEALLPAEVVANALAAREVEVKEEEDEAMEGKKGNSGRARSRKTIKKAALPERLCKGTVLCLTVDLVKQLQQLVQIKSAREQALQDRIQQLQSQLGIAANDNDGFSIDDSMPDFGSDELHSIDEMMASTYAMSHGGESRESSERGRTRDRRYHHSNYSEAMES